jgi:hypothetical protein
MLFHFLFLIPFIIITEQSDPLEACKENVNKYYCLESLHCVEFS